MIETDRQIDSTIIVSLVCQFTKHNSFLVHDYHHTSDKLWSLLTVNSENFET